MGRLLLALAFVLAVGLPPARALVPSWSVALPLAGLTSGLVLSAAAVGSLLTATPLRPWTLSTVAAGWAAGAVAARRRRAALRASTRSGEGGGEGRGEGHGTFPSGTPGITRLRALAGPALLSLPVLGGALAPPTEYDARAIWFFRAHWFWEGGDAARAAMANTALSYSRGEYPPLVPASSGGLWSLLGRADLSVAQAVTTVQTWLAVLLVAVLVAGLARRRAELPVAVAGGLFVLGAFGVAGGFGTRGYADLLWAAAAIAGAVAALVLPVSPAAARVAVVCFAAAVLTKGEGLVTVVLLFAPLAGFRWLAAARRRALPWLGGLAGVIGLAAGWTLIAEALVTRPQEDISPGALIDFLQGDPAKSGRLEPALRGLWGFSRSTFLTAGLLVVAAAVIMRRRRRAGGLGSGLWLPALAVASFAVFVVVLAAGQLEIQFWVAAGGFRTMTVVRGLLLAEVLVVTALLLDDLWARAGPAPVDDGSGENRSAAPVEAGV